MVRRSSRNAEETSYAAESSSQGQSGIAANLWQRALWRWLTVAALMSVFLVVYLRHPYYARSQFDTWRPLYKMVFTGWIVLGLPYVAVTLRRFARRSDTIGDSVLHLMVIARCLLRPGGAAWAWRRRRLRTTLLSLVIKAFFAPLLASFLTNHLASIGRSLALRKHVAVFGEGAAHTSLIDAWRYVHTVGPILVPGGADLGALLHPSQWTVAGALFVCALYYDLLFTVDCLVASAGYCMESCWLKNKTKSVDATALGWTAALMCYPPFNDVLATILPVDATGHFVTSDVGRLVCRLLTLAAFTVYVAATLALGLKFSNLTNRGIIGRGPYRLVRHPAYLCKGFAWWMEYLPGMTPVAAVFLLGLNGVYVLRAWTEERHLSKDPAYCEYRRNVPWVLIPRIY